MVGSAEEGLLIVSPDTQWSPNPLLPHQIFLLPVLMIIITTQGCFAGYKAHERILSHLMLALRLQAKTSNLTLHTMEKPRKVKGPGQGGNDCP